MSATTVTSPKLNRLILLLGLAILLSGLGLFTYLSIYNRHWADDWCYNADLQNKGFLETLNGYFYDTTYTPSRYSVTIFAGALQLFESAGTQWLTPITLLFWMLGLIWLIRNITQLANLQADSALIAYLSALSIYFSVYLTPHLYQSLYWRTGLLTYTTPIVLTIWVLVVITAQARQPQPNPKLTWLAGLSAILAGGCSEAGTTVLVAALAFYVALAWFYRKHLWAQRTIHIASLSLICAIIAMCLLIFSPTTQIRSGRYGAPTPLLELPGLIFNYTYAFFVLSVRDYHHILIAVAAALVGFTFPVIEKGTYPFNRYILLGLAIVVVTALLVAASLTPSIYVEKGLPAPRTMIIPRFLAALGFALGGWVAGLGVRDILSFKWTQTAVTLFMLAALALPVVTIVKASAWIKVYSERTQAWDAREALVQSALEAGMKRVTVQAIDGQPVGGIRDFDPKEKKGYWITQCAEDYYGIKLDVELP